MNEEKKSARTIVFGIIAIALIAAAGLAWKFLVAPIFEERAEAKNLEGDTVRVGLDSFKGYAVLRSPVFRQEIEKQGLTLALIADEADYAARKEALRKGDLHMAVFTIDADLITSPDGKFPGTTVLVIDKSHGADGVVAYEKAVPNVDALNRPDAKLVATPNSPSETLSRHMIASMLPKLTGDSWLIEANGADDVYQKLRRADPAEPRAYVLWESQLSNALALEGVKIIYDSSQISGTIVDVLLVNNRYLETEPLEVRKFVESYLRALDQYASQPGGMVNLLIEDGKLTGEVISATQAERMANTIQWKSTSENYAHFGLLPPDETGGLAPLRSMIASVLRLLVKTGKFDKHPAEGREHELYDDSILKALHSEGFGKQMQSVRAHQNLPALAEAQWDELVIIGNLDAKTIGFRRGNADLTIQGKRDVDEIVQQLQQWPNFYLKVIGHAAGVGNPDANFTLAQARAKNVADRIVQTGIHVNRVRATALRPDAEGSQGLSVTFQLLQR